MDRGLHIAPHAGIDEHFVTRIRTWSTEVLEEKEVVSTINVFIWKTIQELQDFYQKEKDELGIVTGVETDFLATHEAWRGHPRIHICQERLEGVPNGVIQGAIHHEIGHALLHCGPEFYTFRFSSSLQEVARSIGLDLALLQQCVYLLSLTIKDREVVQLIAELGFGFSQISLLDYLISDVEEERRTWMLIRGSPALSRIGFAAFLKVLLPMETLRASGIRGAHDLIKKWHQAYGWLSERERADLWQFVHDAMDLEGETFQQRLEQITHRLLLQAS